MSPSALDRFLDLCADDIDRRVVLATEHRAELQAGAGEFRDALRSAAPIARTPTTVPAVGAVAQLKSSPLGRAAQAASAEIAWVPSPRLDDGGAAVALASLDGVRDLGTLTCGLMLITPHGRYPEHSHPPHEIYLPVAGHDSEWRHGGSDRYRRLGADTLVYNPPDAVHGTRAGDEPVLALFILW